jgi:hypothetical protein
MLRSIDASVFVAPSRKIHVEEDIGSSFGRKIWVAAVILTVHNESPLQGASPGGAPRERTLRPGNWILPSFVEPSNIATREREREGGRGGAEARRESGECALLWMIG